jgi:hypothetical protein
MSGVTKRVYSSRRNVDIGNGNMKTGLPPSIGIPSMLRRFIAKRAPDGVKNDTGGGFMSEFEAAYKEFTGNDSQPLDGFGSSVAMSDVYMVVGAPAADGVGGMVDSGAVYVFDMNGVQLQKLVPNDPSANREFGASVAIDGNYIVVGAPYDSSGTNIAPGTAYVFELSGNAFVQKAKLAYSGSDDKFGRNVAIEGTTVVVGSPYDASGGNVTGAVFLYEISGNNVTQKQRLVAADASNNDAFGSSISINQGRIAIGASNADVSGITDCGAAYIYELSGNNYVYNSKLVASDASDGNVFGSSVSIYGDYVVVEKSKVIYAESSSSTYDGVYVYRKNNGTYNEISKQLSKIGMPYFSVPVDLYVYNNKLYVFVTVLSDSFKNITSESQLMNLQWGGGLLVYDINQNEITLSNKLKLFSGRYKDLAMIYDGTSDRYATQSLCGRNNKVLSGVGEYKTGQAWLHNI